MKLARTRLLLIGWVVAAIVPGVVAAAAFGISINERTGESSSVGVPLVLWLIGFLTQLVLFMAVMRNSTKANVVPWLVASLLPMACDWTAQITMWAAVPCAVAAVGVAALVYVPIARRSDLAVHGVPATGTVLQVIEPRMNVVVNDVYIKRKVRMRVERTDGVPPYEGVLDGLYMLGTIPSVGDVFALRVNREHPQHFQVDDAATPAAPATTTTPASQWRPAPGASVDTASSITTQLERLAQLHASGGLTEDEFEQAKARVLNT